MFILLVGITSKSPTHVSIYVSIISIGTKGIILFHDYKFVSRISYTSGLLNSYQCFIKNNHWLGILAAVYIYQSKFLLDRTIRSSITSKNKQIYFILHMYVYLHCMLLHIHFFIYCISLYIISFLFQLHRRVSWQAGSLSH